MLPLALVVFAKHPTAGRVKTRLQPTYTPAQSAAVQDVFLRHFVRRLAALRLGQVVIAFDPPDAAAEMAQFAADGEVELLPQVEGDLGCRLCAAAGSLSERFEQVLMFGVDSPDVPGTYVRKLPRILAKYDAILAPTDDGGFWALGVRRGVDLERTLAGVEWSSGQEKPQVAANFTAAGYRVGDGDQWSDVDHPADLGALLERLSISNADDDRLLRDALRPIVSGEGAAL
ncbi:MAG TPA: TIGR04282 family arsenosugar biosynthesis glycosyltransferase [Tepidisphaeraceae bacterium]|jgi:hypothetical protein